MLASLEKRRVQTTTWPSRHEDTLSRFVRRLCEFEIERPTVLHVGPGAATKILASYYPAPNGGAKLSWLSRNWRASIRRLDSLLRRLPGIELHSFEPGELQCILPTNVHHRVVDISREVIAAIRKQYPGLSASVCDLSRAPYPESLDAVVCLCVLVRAKESQKIFEHLYRSLKPGGLLVMDNRSVKYYGGLQYPLDCLSNQLFRKPIDLKS